MTTIYEIQEKIKELQIQETALLKENIDSVIAEIKEKMAQYKISLSDLGMIDQGKKIREIVVTRKAPIKYKDGATGNSWSGRGLKPRWLTAAMNQGSTLESFFVKA